MKILGLARVVLLLAAGQRCTQHTVMGASMGNEIDQIFMEDTLDYETGILSDYKDHVKRNSFENELEPEVVNIVVDGVEKANVQAVENTVDYANEEVEMCITDQPNTTDLVSCPSGFIEVAGRCYFFSDSIGYMCKAMDCYSYCLDRGAELAILGLDGYPTDADPLMNYIYNNGIETVYWVGASRHVTYNTYNWVNTNGIELSKESYLWYKWKTDSDWEDAGRCVIIVPDSIRSGPALRDENCDDYKHHFICQRGYEIDQNKDTSI